MEIDKCKGILFAISYDKRLLNFFYAIAGFKNLPQINSWIDEKNPSQLYNTKKFVEFLRDWANTIEQIGDGK